MALVESFRGPTNYWGLTQQKGPWKSTAIDKARAKDSLKNSYAAGGGVAAGGTKNAGHGNYEQVMTPYQINATGAPPKPSAYALVQPNATREYQQKGVVGRGRPQALPVASRTRPFYTGEEAGEMAGLPVGYSFPGAPQGADTGNVLAAAPASGMSGQTYVDLLPASPQDYVPMIETFGATEHRIQEATISPPLTAQENELFGKVKPVPGVFKKPGHKIRTKPTQKGFKQMARAETVRESPENIVQLTYPVKEVPVTTFVPPKFDQVIETKKASIIAIKDERKDDVTLNFEPWVSSVASELTIVRKSKNIKRNEVMRVVKREKFLTKELVNKKVLQDVWVVRRNQTQRISLSMHYLEVQNEKLWTNL